VTKAELVASLSKLLAPRGALAKLAAILKQRRLHVQLRPT